MNKEALLLCLKIYRDLLGGIKMKLKLLYVGILIGIYIMKKN